MAAPAVVVAVVVVESWERGRGRSSIEGRGEERDRGSKFGALRSTLGTQGARRGRGWIRLELLARARAPISRFGRWPSPPAMSRSGAISAQAMIGHHFYERWRAESLQTLSTSAAFAPRCMSVAAQVIGVDALKRSNLARARRFGETCAGVGTSAFAVQVLRNNAAEY
eukprot:5927346-Pyramimonas_sp.AAC.1